MTVPYYEGDGVTLYHGDCLEVTEWLAADVLVTDPPYGIAGGRVGWHMKGGPIHADAAWDKVDVRDAALGAWGDKPRAVFGSPRRLDIAPTFTEVPLVWDKGNTPGMGNTKWPWGPSYELIYLSGAGWSGVRRASVLRYPHTSAAATDHPTPKPVSLMGRIIETCPPGTIADPFAGSGSTLVAARNLGRKAIGVEIEERYCEIIVRRLDQAVLPL